MIDTILVLLAALGFGLAWEVDWYPRLESRPQFRGKPWSCPLCMSAWAGSLGAFFLGVVVEPWSWIAIKPVLFGFAAYGVAYLVRRVVQYMEDLRV